MSVNKLTAGLATTPAAKRTIAMSDDDNRRGPSGPRGPRKPGGGYKGKAGGGFGSRSGGRDERPARSFGNDERPQRKSFNDERPQRSGSYKPSGGFKPAGSNYKPGAFRDAPAASDRPRDDRSERPRRFEGEGFKPRAPRGDAGPRRDSGDRPPRRAYDDRAPRPFRDGERPERSSQDRVRSSRGERDGQHGATRNDGPPRSSSRPERRPFLPREGNPERLASPEKEGGAERIAKVIARAGAASRRDAEVMIEQGRVAVDGHVISSPALDVLPTARITIDGDRLPARERTRLWLYHKPSGLVATNHDPEGRTTLFETLPEDLPRVITIGRLDINTEGLLLLTNDGGLARVLGHPETGWLRRYRVRAYGQITQDKLDAVRGGVVIDGENFGPVVATRDREVGDNTWLTVDLREGKNREVKRVLEHLGLIVNRLIRISFGPFQLGELAEGQVDEVRSKVLRDQLGEQLATIAGVDFDTPVRNENRLDREPAHENERGGGRAPQGRGAPPDRDAARGRGERPRSGAPHGQERGPRREAGDERGQRKPREGAYHRAREESGDAPRDILLRAEEGRGAIWRDVDTTQMKPQRTGPRRGADPREERNERAERDAAGGRERVRAKPIEDPNGRRVQVERVNTERVNVERVSGASPDLPRKPRYTRADFAAPSGEERPFRRPREEGDRPPRREAGDRPPRRDFGDRPPRTDGDRPFNRPRTNRPDGERGGDGFKPRAPRGDFKDRGDFKERSASGPRKDFGDRPPRRDFGDKPPRGNFGDRSPRADGERTFRPRADGDRPARSFSGAGERSEGRGGFGGKPPGRNGPGRGGPGRGGPGHGGPGRSGPSGRGAPDRGGDKPRGPRKPKF